jgi:hypothetical protein
VAVAKRTLIDRRVIAFLLLIFIFFLPLHFHPADETRRIDHECSCYHGVRTQLGSAPSPAILPVAPVVFFLIAAGAEAPARSVIQSDFARAPPVPL